MPTFDTPRPITAVLELNVADVKINATERTDTVVEVRPRNAASERDVQAAEQTTVEFADDVLTVRMPKVRSISLFSKPGAIDLEISLRSGSALQAKAALGAVHASGSLGTVNVRTATGDLRLEQTGPLELNTASGTVVLDHADGDVRIVTADGRVNLGHLRGRAVVKNSNGDTRIGRVDGDLQVSNANGDITVLQAGGDVSASTASGSVRVEQVTTGTVTVQTAAGSLHVGVAAGTAAWLDLNTLFGKVRSELSNSGAPGRDERRVQIKARTSMGDIDIVRAGQEQPA